MALFTNGARSSSHGEKNWAILCTVIMCRYEEVSVLADVIHVYWKKLMPQWRKWELSIAACITGVWLESMKSCWDPETTHLFTIGSSFFLWKGLLLFLVQSSYWTEHTMRPCGRWVCFFLQCGVFGQSAPTRRKRGFCRSYAPVFSTAADACGLCSAASI